MNHYDDLQRFKDKTHTQRLKFRDLSTQSVRDETGDWVILNQFTSAAGAENQDPGLAMGGSISRIIPQPVSDDAFAYVAEMSSPTQSVAQPPAARINADIVRNPAPAAADDSVQKATPEISADAARQPAPKVGPATAPQAQPKAGAFAVPKPANGQPREASILASMAQQAPVAAPEPSSVPPVREAPAMPLPAAPVQTLQMQAPQPSNTAAAAVNYPRLFAPLVPESEQRSDKNKDQPLKSLLERIASCR